MNFIFSGTETRAITLCRIPFTHASELILIFNHLRQQILFNELISSCTKSTGDPTLLFQELGIPVPFFFLTFPTHLLTPISTN